MLRAVLTPATTEIGRRCERTRALVAVVALAALCGTTACDPVCDVAHLTVVGGDQRVGVPCVFELQGAGDPPDALYLDGPAGRTGETFTLRTYQRSGTYRLVALCEGYARGTTRAFEWKLQRPGCGEPADLGTITVVPEATPAGAALGR